MTTNDFDRRLADWLHLEAEHRVPDHLDAVLVRTVATRQRAWWSSPERWLPVDTTLRRRPFDVGPAARLIAAAIMVLLVIALAVLAVGSRQDRLPEPFGLARNGAIVTSRDGDIYRIDPTTAESIAIVSGPGFDFAPIFSRDGTRFTFLRSDVPLSTTDPAILTLYVANADGSGLRALTPPTKSLDWFDWSPDGTRIAYMAEGDLYVGDVAGGEPRRLDVGGPIHYPTWLPPDGQEILVLRLGDSPAVFAITPDGTELRPVSRTPGNNQFDYQGIAASPDGAHVTFTRWFAKGPDGRGYPDDLGWLPRVFVMNVTTGVEEQLPTLAGTGQRGPTPFSPDGERVAYARIYRTGAYQLVVANADGSGDEQVIGERRPCRPDGASVDAAWAFTPDGTALLVRYGNDDRATTWLYPIDGSPPTDLGTGAFDFVDMQRLAD